MSEHYAARTVSTFKGAAPGYMSKGGGGVLSEAVRRHPHSIMQSEFFDECLTARLRLGRMIEAKQIEPVHVGVEAGEYRYLREEVGCAIPRS
ncbi:MAG: hypothetical protein QNI99_09550 [Woeseiaceae bacterium]|nr:hypothetical protein [Woeseiaceae bacterium]